MVFSSLIMKGNQVDRWYILHYRCTKCKHEWENVDTFRAKDICPECGSHYNQPLAISEVYGEEAEDDYSSLDYEQGLARGDFDMLLDF